MGKLTRSVGHATPWFALGPQRCYQHRCGPSVFSDQSNFVYKTPMTTSSEKKRVGRPPTGAGTTIAIRIPTQAIEAIDKRAKEQGTTRTAIARQLLMKALGLKQKP